MTGRVPMAVRDLVEGPALMTVLIVAQGLALAVVKDPVEEYALLTAPIVARVLAI